VRVSSFETDETPVTNRQFAEFVASTLYVTTAEVAPDCNDYPRLDQPGSAQCEAAASAKRKLPE